MTDALPPNSYRPPSFSPLQRVRIVDEFPWGGPSFGLTGKSCRIVGMEARIAPMSDARYGNDPWDYKLEMDDGGPPVWMPSSALERGESRISRAG